MAGEINFGILNQNLPAEIAGSYYKGQEQQQQNALAKQQLSQAQMSTQVSGMQLEKMKRDAAALDQMQKAIAKNGGPPDLKSAAQAMINSGMPDHINHGLTLLQKLQDLEDNKRIMGMGGPTAAPAAGGMSEPYAGYNAAIGAPAGPAANEPYTGYNAAIGAPTENALAPAAAQPPVANALAPTNTATAKAQQIALLRQQKNAFMAKGNISAANSLEKDIALLSKPTPYQNVVGVGLVNPETKEVITPSVEPTPTNVKEFAAFREMDPAQQVQYLKFLASKTPKTSVSVAQSTEKGYGTQFAGEVAKGDVVLRAAAQDAPLAAENANRILQTLASGKPIVGAGADIKLGIAKLLNIAGADNAEIISKTEGMVASMAQNTLNAIKTSGLGTGQGFTDKDLKFLEAAKSGNINFQPDTIRQLAELSHKAAEATADKWNSRAREIPASAIQGTGVSLEPVRVPKRASSVTEGVRPSGVGANWTLLVDANGSKAWVSPDRKQIKEVQ